jgi:hypothetical protein
VSEAMPACLGEPHRQDADQPVELLSEASFVAIVRMSMWNMTSATPHAAVGSALVERPILLRATACPDA